MRLSGTRQRRSRSTFQLASTLALAAILAAGCTGGGQSDLMAIAQARGMDPDDAARALKTFVPPGEFDDYLLFASGGHSGQVLVVGIPSMRILKVIGVFTPEPWQGYGYGSDSSAAVLAASSPVGEEIRWG